MGMLQPGDVLLSINDQSLENANLRDAAQLLKNVGEVVVLQISKESTNMSEPAVCMFVRMCNLYACLYECVVYVCLCVSVCVNV